MLRFPSVLVILTVPMLLALGSDDVHKELKTLEGKWRAVGLEAGGKPLPKASVPDFLFIVGADGQSTGQMGKVEYQSKVTIDVKKDPKTIDNAHETGAHQGKKQFGIYKMKGNQWIVCMTAPGAKESDRPTSFDTKDTNHVVFIFERVNDDKH